MSVKSDKMANWPVTKLLFSMGLPAVFSMLIQALYNVVDTIYISRYSQDALFAIGIVTPMQMVGLSIALGAGAGIGTLVARKLGERNSEEASKIASTGLLLAAFHSLIVMAMGLLLTRPFIRIFSQRPEIIELGYQYLVVVMVFCFGQQFNLVIERTMQAQSNMLPSTLAQLIGAATNIILDPILIFGLGPIAPMGIRGAAVATVAGQILSLCFLIAVVLFGKHEVRISLRGLKLSFKRIAEIYSIGLPTMVMNAVGSLTTILMNNVLVNFSELAVSSLSMYFKIQSFIFMPVFGFNQGALPILSYNFGAQNKERYLKTLKLFLLVACLCLGSGTLLFNLAPDVVLSFFEMDAELHAITTVTIKRISLSYIFAAVSIVVSTLFQSFGRGVTSMLQQMLRQLFVLIPLAYFLASFGNLDVVWYAYLIAEVVVMLVFLPLAFKTFRKHFA